MTVTDAPSRDTVFYPFFRRGNGEARGLQCVSQDQLADGAAWDLDQDVPHCSLSRLPCLPAPVLVSRHLSDEVQPFRVDALSVSGRFWLLEQFLGFSLKLYILEVSSVS